MSTSRSFSADLSGRKASFIVRSSPSNIDRKVVRSECPRDRVVSALELKEFALNMEVSAVELKDSALGRKVSPPNDSKFDVVPPNLFLSSAYW